MEENWWPFRDDKEWIKNYVLRLKKHEAELYERITQMKEARRQDAAKSTSATDGAANMVDAHEPPQLGEVSTNTKDKRREAMESTQKDRAENSASCTTLNSRESAKHEGKQRDATESTPSTEGATSTTDAHKVIQLGEESTNTEDNRREATESTEGAGNSKSRSTFNSREALQLDEEPANLEDMRREERESTLAIEGTTSDGTCSALGSCEVLQTEEAPAKQDL